MDIKLFARLLSAMLITITIITGCSASEDNKQILSTIAQFETKKPGHTPVNNKEKVFRALGAWPKPPLYQGNYFASGGIGSIPAMLIQQGLFQQVRTTGKTYYAAAESCEHQDHKTIITLKKGIRWHDGHPYTSKDVWAYYILRNNVVTTNYLSSIEIPDDYTIVFNWADPEPFLERKMMLITQDGQGAIPYHIYKPFVDETYEIFKRTKPIEEYDKRVEAQLAGRRTPFTLNLSKQDLNDLAVIWKKFQESGPAYPIGTGPYKFEKVTATDYILTKNNDYWDKDNVYFDKVWLKEGLNFSAELALLRAGRLEYFGETPTRDLLESMLESNKNLVHYKMLDPASVGFYFNTKKYPFDNLKFRQAVVYALNRQKIREVANYYAREYNKYSALALVPSEAEGLLSEETKSKMTDYSYNPQKAAQLLEEIGWRKGTDGIWVDQNGKKADFLIGCNSAFTLGVNSSQIAAEQLTSFGLPTRLMAVEGSIYFKNADGGFYDMSTDWIDMCYQNMDPLKPLTYNYKTQRKKIGLNVIKKLDNFGKEVATDMVDVTFTGLYGETVQVATGLWDYSYVHDVKVRNRFINSMSWYFNEQAFGVGYFQNATGAFVNIKTMDGYLPMAEEIAKGNRNLPLPASPSDIKNVPELNFSYSFARMIYGGKHWPR